LIVSRDDASKVEGFAKNQRPLIECIANQVGAMIRRENESSEASGFRQWRGPRGRLTKKTPVPLLARRLVVVVFQGLPFGGLDV